MMIPLGRIRDSLFYCDNPLNKGKGIEWVYLLLLYSMLKCKRLVVKKKEEHMHTYTGSWESWLRIGIHTHFMFTTIWCISTETDALASIRKGIC